MSVTLTNEKRDGDLCVLTFKATDNGSVTTPFDVVGHITQVALHSVTGSDTVRVALEDTSTGMSLISNRTFTSDLSNDFGLSSFKQGGGGYCSGPLKFTVSLHAGSVEHIWNLFYTKL